MASSFEGWKKVAEILRSQGNGCETHNEKPAWLNAGQRASVRAVAKRIPENGVIIADEVGMGKTRIVVAAIAAVVEAGGRVAVVVPPGLGFQWHEELRDGFQWHNAVRGVELPDAPAILRSYWSYLEAWAPEQPEHHKPWFNEKVIVVSHRFANWRIGMKSDNWRRALLPEVYAQWRMRQARAPRFYKDNEVLKDPWVKNAAKSIVEAVPLAGNHPGHSFLNHLADNFNWTGTLDGDYGQGTELRAWLEKTVGLGLGVFDLVVIDEAHKSRGTDSGLSRLLETVLCTRDAHARRICMTATPVELDVSQWSDPLQRIGLEQIRRDSLKTTIDKYAEAVRKLRQRWRESEQAREEFCSAASLFQNALQPYVLRRDKREDEHVQKFHQIAGPIAHYRRESEAMVDTATLSPEWKQAVCGAEALSLVTRQADDDAATQRLRLTLGNGHGIATFLDESRRDAQADAKQEACEDQRNRDAKPGNPKGSAEHRPDNKRRQRAEWWASIVKQGLGNKGNALFDHPVLTEAVRTIEKHTSKGEKGEKVLVFGRFTEPMRALTNLLNAREMLRRVYRGEPWPQRKVHESEGPAVRKAWEQLRNELKLPDLDETELDRNLDEQYKRLEQAREGFRESLIERLEKGLDEIGVKPDSQYHAAHSALSRSVTIADNDDLALVARTLIELSGGASRKSLDWLDDVPPRDLALAFRELIDSAADRDDPDADEDADGKIDETEAARFWENLLKRIKEEYARNQGGFARFMYGQTEPSSRRLIQQAFNRAGCFPMVLVAQSLVGREGLNLHKACRTVVLLHPEWNPGIVEQQIGRVDRVNSHWCKLLDEAAKSGVSANECPHIEVIAIVFKGTYDEHNWTVLRQRWDDLRAQLHGVVIPRPNAEDDSQEMRIWEKLENQAPYFSPSKSRAASDHV
ncbi:MAG: type III restriction endonuclease subunit R [Planctomycetaceae bacterium]|nr:hypothetical protein [Planctomycetales bacterium]MCB9920559.1 type III restriction endonuclease subunit R [Planctomycetaceae bacterium]